MAGRGGLNLTHSEDFERFVGRYGEAAPILRPMLEAFTPADLIAWAEGLGQATFVGTSGRVFPKALKASPLLRAWMRAAGGAGRGARTSRSTWTGWNAAGDLTLRDARRPARRAAARHDPGPGRRQLGQAGLGRRLGRAAGGAGRGSRAVPPGQCRLHRGVERGVPRAVRRRAAEEHRLSFDGRTSRGDAMVAGYGLEGGAVYALSAALRDAIDGARARRRWRSTCARTSRWRS